jgi:hypothetical protein
MSSRAFDGRPAGRARVSRRPRPGDEVSRLLDRLRKLVADQQRLEGRELQANRREVARLQRRLATVVKRELAA